MFFNKKIQLTVQLTSLLRERSTGFPPHPRIIPATIVDLPVPLGPMIMLRFFPGMYRSSS